MEKSGFGDQAISVISAIRVSGLIAPWSDQDSEGTVNRAALYQWHSDAGTGIEQSQALIGILWYRSHTTGMAEK